MRVLCSLAILSTACSIGATGPRGGAVKTGERVAVVDDVKTWTTQYQEHTSTSEYRDADGNVVGTRENYVDRTKVHRKPVWYPVQGRQQITDEDFFQITGDQISMKRAHDHRARGRLYAGLGIAGMLVGIAGMIAGRYALPERQGLGIGLYTGGAVFGLAGAYGFYVGREMQSPDSHAVDRSVAETAARDYNRTLGASVGISRQW